MPGRRPARLGAYLCRLGLAACLASPAWAADAPSPLSAEQLRAYAELVSVMRETMVEAPADDRLFGLCLQGMVSGSDPYSSYIDADETRELMSQSTSQSAGIGLELAMADGSPVVVAPLDGSPAQSAGVHAGDRIVAIDGKVAKGLPLGQLVKQLRGAAGSQVALGVLRGREPQVITFTMRRAVLSRQSVSRRLVGEGLAYVRISQFLQATGPDLAEAVGALYRQGPVQGIVLDLRDNPGGLMTAAVAVAAVFLPEGAPVLSTVGRTPESSDSYRATPAHYQADRRAMERYRSLPADIKTVPLAVLVNKGSAAASEIVAAALQDHKRATILGANTFGRASIQTVRPLSGGRTAVKLTTARWLSPLGRSVESGGLVPDVGVEGGAAGASPDPALDQALLRLKQAQ